MSHHDAPDPPPRNAAWSRPWMHGALRAVLCAGMLGACWLLPDRIEAVTMDAQAQVLDRLLKLPDEVYLRRDDAVLQGLPTAVLATGVQGLFLGGPRQVPLQGERTLPTLLVTAQSAQRRAAVDLRRNALVVACEVDSGEVHVAIAFPSNDEKSPGEPPRPADDKAAAPPQPVPADPALWAQLGAGNTAGTAWLDVYALLGLPWQQGRWAIRVLAYDTLSNPAYTQIGPHPNAQASLSRTLAQATVARLRAEAQAPPGLPSFVRVPQTPTLATGGVAFVLGRSQASAGSGPIPLHAALRVPLSGPSIVETGVPGRGPALPTAIVKAMVLVAFKDHALPVRIPVEVPVWTDPGAKAGTPVEVVFSLDLAAHLPAAPAPGELQVYLFAGPYASGPQGLTWR